MNQVNGLCTRDTTRDGRKTWSVLPKTESPSTQESWHEPTQVIQKTYLVTHLLTWLFVLPRENFSSRGKAPSSNKTVTFHPSWQGFENGGPCTKPGNSETLGPCVPSVPGRLDPSESMSPSRSTLKVSPGITVKFYRKHKLISIVSIHIRSLMNFRTSVSFRLLWLSKNYWSINNITFKLI